MAVKRPVQGHELWGHAALVVEISRLEILISDWLVPFL